MPGALELGQGSWDPSRGCGRLGPPLRDQSSEESRSNLPPCVTRKGWSSPKLVPPIGRSSQGLFLQHLAQEEVLREKRSVPKGKKSRRQKLVASQAAAAHYEVRAAEDRAGIYSGSDGTIQGWAETQLNVTSPLTYNPAKGEFAVVRRGLYYLYCQVHFNEGRTVYMKLDVVVDGVLALRCLEQFPPTSAGPHDPELRVCQVSGLLLLQPPSILSIRTIPNVRLKAERYLTFFGLFQNSGALAPRPPSAKINRPPPPPRAGEGTQAAPRAPAHCVTALQVWESGEPGLLLGTLLRQRGKRFSENSRDQDQRQPHRKRSVLHLAPSHCSTNDEGDMTEIWWQPFLQQGQALEISGPDITVKKTGLYLIYSQVLFHDPTFTMGQVLWRAPLGGPGQILLRCVQSMPRELEQAYNSCYSAGVFQLQRGDRLSLRIPRANASLDLSPHGTFLGLFRL
nr:uncharacterized protein LOC102454093 [Pelodiscus sinensis]|eukprot:XP_025044196.1 uncharacterized protein LOC102454093 [Pelodiscus sinensis]